MDRQRHLDRAVEEEEDTGHREQPEQPRLAGNDAPAPGRRCRRGADGGSGRPRRGRPAAYRQDREAHRVGTDHPAGTDQCGQAAGEGRAYHQRRLRERRQDRVAVHPVPFLGQRLRDERVRPAAAPRVQQRREREQDHIHDQVERSRHRQYRDHAQHDRPKRGVHGDQSNAAEPAHQPGQRGRADGGRQRVRRHRQPGPDTGLVGWRDLHREPRHRDHAHPIAECGDQHRRQDPAKPRLAQHPADGLDP